MGQSCTIQDECVISTCGSLVNGLPSKCVIGSNVYISSHCVVYSAQIKDNCFIGANCQILEGSLVEEGCIIGPNSVVPPGRVIPSHQLWAGNPVQYVKDVAKPEIQHIINASKWNNLVAQDHKYFHIIFHCIYSLNIIHYLNLSKIRISPFQNQLSP